MTASRAPRYPSPEQIACSDGRSLHPLYLAVPPHTSRSLGYSSYRLDAPVELAKALVGFRHDECGDEGDVFEVLADLRPQAPKKGFWARLLGR